MTDVIELAKQAEVPHVNACRHSLERFATLVRNAALDEAAQICDNADCLQNRTFNGAAQAIRNLKEPTP